MVWRNSSNPNIVLPSSPFNVCIDVKDGSHFMGVKILVSTNNSELIEAVEHIEKTHYAEIRLLLDDDWLLGLIDEQILQPISENDRHYILSTVNEVDCILLRELQEQLQSKELSYFWLDNDL